MQRCARVWAVVVVGLLAEGLVGCSSKSPPPPPDPPPEVEVFRPLTLTEDARIPQNDPSYTGVEIHADRVVLLYSGAPETVLSPGHVIAGNADSGYLRRVVAVGALTNGRIEVITEPAFLTDFIADGHFRVRTHPDATAWAESDGQIGGRPFALETEYSILDPSTLLDLPCGAKNLPGISPIFDIDLDLELEVDVSQDGLLSVPTLDYALFAATGSVEVGLSMGTTEPLSVSCTIDLIELLRNGNPNRFKLELTPIRFAIGPVPVVVTHTIEPTYEIEAGVETTLVSGRLSGTIGYQVRAGAEKSGGEWRGIWEPMRLGDIFFTEPNEPGALSASLAVSAGPQYSAFIYDTAGPNMAIQGTVGGEFNLSAETCAWDASLSAGIDLVLGASVQVPVIEVELASFSATFHLASEEVEFASGTFDLLCVPDAGVPDAEVADASELDSGLDSGMADAAGGCPPLPPADAGVSGPIDALYYVNGTTLFKANLDGSGAVTIATGLSGPRQVAVDPVGRKVYWVTSSTISRANLDGSGAEAVFGVTAVDVAVDGANGKVYWTDLFEKKIRRANIDTSCVEAIATTGDLPDSLAVDPAGGMVYFTETINAGTEIAIRRVGLAGGSVQTLLVRPSFVQAWIDVDPVGGKIYWGENIAGAEAISRANLDGSGVETIVSGFAKEPWGLVVDGVAGFVYWTQFGGGMTGTVRRAPAGGGGVTDLVTGLSSPLGVAVGPGN